LILNTQKLGIGLIGIFGWSAEGLAELSIILRAPYALYFHFMLRLGCGFCWTLPDSADGSC
jgi:hypothetical protein